MSNEFIPASVKVAALQRALADMVVAHDAAKYVADNDPSFIYFREYAEQGEKLWADPNAYMDRYLATRDPALSDMSVRQALQTGIIVTYARPFTYGDDAGFPLAEEIQEQIIPSDKRDLHDQVIRWRHKVEAHTDNTPGTPLVKKVEHFYDESSKTWQTQQMARGGLGEVEYRALADLAWTIMLNLRGLLDDAKRVEHSTLKTPIDDRVVADREEGLLDESQ